MTVIKKGQYPNFDKRVGKVIKILGDAGYAYENFDNADGQVPYLMLDNKATKKGRSLHPILKSEVSLGNAKTDETILEIEQLMRKHFNKLSEILKDVASVEVRQTRSSYGHDEMQLMGFNVIVLVHILTEEMEFTLPRYY